jgi:hypothetical protein
MNPTLQLNGFSPSAIGAEAFADEALTAAKFHADAAAKLILGKVVQRATANLPATATAAIFTVTGRVAATIVGEVTTVIQTQACNAKLQSNPTAAGSSVDLCADLDISAKAVATLLGITGTFANAMVAGVALPLQAAPVVLQAGTIDLVTSATNTGQVKWTVRYVPIDDGATVVAA